ncbi:MAG: hypothetical protein VB127_01495 [Sphaerochaeta sp.]|nr:hypothetical protein [Sphaerochaeta sp.]
MNKRFLWICIVLMALVLVVGCEDSPTDGSGGSGGSGGSDIATVYASLNADQKLLFEFFMTMGELEDVITVDSDDTHRATFSYTLDSTYDTTITTALGLTPQYIHDGATVTGTLALTGITFAEFQDDENEDTYAEYNVTMTYSATITGDDLPTDPTTIGFSASGRYGDDEPETVTFTVNSVSISFTIPSFE